MSIEYLKKASRKSTDDAGDVRATVQAILDEIEDGRRRSRHDAMPRSSTSMTAMSF